MIGLKTNHGAPAPCPRSREALRLERDWAADEARWEAQLRKAGRAIPMERQPAIVRGPAVRTMLDVVDGVTRYDSLIIPRALPVTTGSEAEDLACGKCGSAIASRASRDTVRRSYPQGERLVIRCTCRALNVICGKAGRNNRQFFRQRTPRSPRT